MGLGEPVSDKEYSPIGIVSKNLFYLKINYTKPPKYHIVTLSRSVLSRSP